MLECALVSGKSTRNSQNLAPWALSIQRLYRKYFSECVWTDEKAASGCDQSALVNAHKQRRRLRLTGNTAAQDTQRRKGTGPWHSETRRPLHRKRRRQPSPSAGAAHVKQCTTARDSPRWLTSRHTHTHACSHCIPTQMAVHGGGHGDTDHGSVRGCQLVRPMSQGL